MTEERRRDLLVRLTLVGAGLAPGAALGVAFWPELSGHPAVTVAAVAGYTLLVSAVAFLGRVASVLQRRWAERTGDAIDRRLRWTVSRFERAYRARLRSRYRFVDLQGLSTRGDHTPKLSTVFVDVRLVRRAPHLTTQDSPVGVAPYGLPDHPGPDDGAPSAAAGTAAGADGGRSDGVGATRDPAGLPATVRAGGGPETSGAGAGLGRSGPGEGEELPVAEESTRSSVTDFLTGPSGVALAVIGAPGTGKTTLLKYLALHPPTTRRGRGRRHRARRRDLPVLLSLHRHAARITADPSVTLPEVIRASLGGFAAQEPPGWLEQRLRAGRCLVLLDGLDEVGRESDRLDVSGWVEQQIAQYEDNDFVITSRPHGYQNTRLNRAQVLQVQRFTGDQISRFVHTWYRSVEQLSTREDDADVTARADEAAGDLLDRLRERPVLYDLAANPLLLTMTALVHRYRDVLPRSRAELYTEICEVLLWRRQEAKRIGLPAERELTGRQKEAVLRVMAYAMMTGRQRDIDTERADEILAPVLDLVSAGMPPADFLRLVSASGMLVEREPGRYSFAHLTLQEHLAALHIQEYGLSDVLVEAVADDWWRETTLLYAARVDPAPIVEACLAPGANPTTLALAFECAEVAVKFRPATARRLEELRREALTDPVDSPRHRLITAVTVTRALRGTVRLTDEVELTARPVPREMFRLFLASERGVAPPEPAARGAVTGPGDAPATGVTRRQAAALLRWVNGLLPDGVVYRLPTRDEVAELHHTHRAMRPCWFGGVRVPTAAPAALWVPDGERHPWTAVLPTPDDWPDPETWALLRVGQVGLTRGRAEELAHVLGEARPAPGALIEPRRLAPALGVARRLADDLDLACRLDLGLDEVRREELREARRHAGELADALDVARNADLAFDLDHHVGQARAAEFTVELARLREHAGTLAGQPVLRYLARRLHGAALVHAVLRERPRQRASRTREVPADTDHTVRVIRAYLREHREARAVPPDALRAALGDLTTAEGTAPRPGTGAHRIRRAGGGDRATGGTGRLAQRSAGRGSAERGQRAAPRGAGRDGPPRRRNRRAEQLHLLTEDTARRARAALRDRDTTDRATAVALQLACLALAAAADRRDLNDPFLAARYRTAALGATAQRQRARDEVEGPETLLLVRDTAL